MDKLYNEYNKDGEKNVQFVMINSEKSGNKEDYKKVVVGQKHPWVALPYKSEKEKEVKKLVPFEEDEFLTIGVLNGTTGAVIDPCIYGNHNDFHYESWLEHAEKRKTSKIVYDIWYRKTAVFQ